MLFILHSTNANHSRRGAERVLRVKVRKGLIQENLLQKTFKGHAQVCFHSHAHDQETALIMLPEVLAFLVHIKYGVNVSYR